MTYPNRTLTHCDLCDKPLKHGKVPRHKLSNACLPPVQDCFTISQVLRHCKIQPEDIGNWPLALLDKLPNLRKQQPALPRAHTPFKFLPPALDLQLPSLASVVEHVYQRSLPQHQSRWGTGTVWIGPNKTSLSSSAQWKTWMAGILTGTKESKSLLNIPSGKIFQQENGEQPFQIWSSQLLRQLYSRPDPHLDTGTFNINPRLTRTEIHHDSEPHASIAIGHTPTTTTKLWILWPTTEVAELNHCYANTTKALEHLSNGSFFVQMSGETLVVPRNAPHAVLTLNPCYLLGHLAHPTFALGMDPSTLTVDLKGNRTLLQATTYFLDNLRAGLQNPLFRSTYITHFNTTWFSDAGLLRLTDKHAADRLCQQVLALWTADVAAMEVCAFCEFNGQGSKKVLAKGRAAHVAAHLGL